MYRSHKHQLFSLSLGALFAPLLFLSALESSDQPMFLLFALSLALLPLSIAAPAREHLAPLHRAVDSGDGTQSEVNWIHEGTSLYRRFSSRRSGVILIS